MYKEKEWEYLYQFIKDLSEEQQEQIRLLFNEIFGCYSNGVYIDAIKSCSIYMSLYSKMVSLLEELLPKNVVDEIESYYDSCAEGACSACEYD